MRELKYLCACSEALCEGPLLETSNLFLLPR